MKEILSTLAKSNTLGLKKEFHLRENSAYVGSKTIENKEELYKSLPYVII